MDGAAVRKHDSGDQVQERRLARSARTQYPDALAPRDTQRRNAELEVALRVAEQEIVDANHRANPPPSQGDSGELRILSSLPVP